MKKFTLFLGALLISMVSMAANYVKVTEAPADWSGEYLLVYEGEASAHVWTGVDAANGNVEATATDGTISGTDFVTITVAPMEGGYSIKVNGGANDGKYISGTEGSNKLNFGTTAVLNTLAYEDGSVKIVSNTSVMRFNNAKDNMRFRYFKSSTYTGQKVVQLYKLADGTSGETPDDGGETPDDDGETPANVTFDFTTKDGLEALGIAYPTTDAGNGAYATDLEEGKAYSQNGISLTAKYGSTATRIWLAASGKLDLRHYKGGVLTFAAPSGKVITNIVFDGADVSGLTTLVDKAWTGNASTVEIPAAADAQTIKINTITVHVADASSDYVATPAISGETNFLENTTVTITAEEGLEVYYTLDGTDPTKASIKYTAPFELTATTIVKAIAYNGDKASAVVCKTFTKTPLIGCAEVNALANGEIAYMKPFDVVYVVEGAGYIYIKDETGNALIYSYDWDESTYFTPGDHVEGFIGKSSPYNGLPELKPNCNYEDLTITKGGTPTEPTILTEVPEAADVHKYVQFNGVKFKEDATFAKDKATNATMLVAETEVVLRNAFKLETALMANKQYNVVGFVALYNDAVQVYFLKAEALSTAVDNITIDQNAVKFIENGQLVIVKDGVRYNALGQVTK